MSAARTIWVLPGGRFQVPLIEAAQAMGCRVVCSDRNANCDGSVVADEFVQLGVDQRDALFAAMKEYRPDGLATDQTDSAVATTAWLADQLGLPGIGLDCAQTFTNKRRMRETFGGHGFPVPEHAMCDDFEACEAAVKRISWPVILKPEVGQSSKGVNRVDQQSGLTAAFEDTLGFGPVIVEQWIDGPEFTVEGWMSGGRHHSLAVSIKSHYSHRPMVAESLLYTPTHADFDFPALCAQNDELVEVSGLSFGITHAEYRFADGKFWLMEIAARGCGSLVTSHLVPEVSGVKVYDHYLASVLGHEVPPVRIRDNPRFAVLEFMGFKPGRIQAIEGLDEARSISGVLEVAMNYDLMECLPLPTDDTNRPGYFIAVADTLDELQLLRGQVSACVQVIYDE